MFYWIQSDKEIRPLCIFFPEMNIYKRYSNKTKCMYFMIKDENIFDKPMAIWEIVSNVIKTNFNSELIYNQKYLKAEKRFNARESFQYFYVPVILLDLVYRKDGIYYPKVSLEKLVHNFFWKSIIIFGSWGFGSSS